MNGYPTLKFSLDGGGEIYDYPGGRAARDFLEFAHKMLRPVVDTVTSVAAAHEFAARESEEGVAFLAYHPAVVAPEEAAGLVVRTTCCRARD